MDPKSLILYVFMIVLSPYDICFSHHNIIRCVSQPLAYAGLCNGLNCLHKIEYFHLVIDVIMIIGWKFFIRISV